eukprot:975638_1
MELNLLKSLNRLRWEYIDWDTPNATRVNWTVIDKEYFKDLNIYTAQVYDTGRLSGLGYDSDALVYTSVLTISAIRTLNSGYCYNVTSAPRHILQPGKRYGFRLYVIADSIINDRYDEYFHSDVLNLTTNQFATDGECILELVDKSSTKARLLDKFYFRCDGWRDPDSLQGNFSLKFNALMNDVLIQNALLSKLWTTDPTSIIGMIGTKALKIKALIRDDLGAITCFDIDIDNSFPSASLTDEEILEAIRRIIRENELGKENAIAVALGTILEGLLFIGYANDDVLSQIMDLIVVNVVDTSYATNPSHTSAGRVLSESTTMKGLLHDDRLIFSDSASLLVEEYLPTLYSTIDLEIIAQPPVELDPSIGDSLNQIALKSFNLADRLEVFMGDKGLDEFSLDHNKVLESFVEFSAYSGHIALAQSYPGTEFVHTDDTGKKKIFTTKIDPNNTADAEAFNSCGFQDGNSIQIPPIFDSFYDCSFVEQHDAYFEPRNSVSQMEKDRTNTLSNTTTINLYNGDVYNSYFDTRRRRMRRRRMAGVVDGILDLSTSLLESTEILDRCAPYWIQMKLSQNSKGLFTKEDQESNTFALGQKTPYPACTFWNTESKKWDTNNCFVYNYTENDVLCACKHLTTFNIKASDFKPQANLISVYHFRDLSEDNLTKYPYVWVTLTVVLCVFLLICLYDAFAGNKDDRSPLAYSDIMFSAVREHKMKSFIPSNTTQIFEQLYSKKHKHYGVGLIKSIRKDNKLCTNQLKLFKIYLQNNHTLLSIFQHSEGTGYSKRQRVASFYLYLSTIMVSSAAFYGVEQQKFGDITASFLISLWSTIPAVFVRFSFTKAKPKHTPITINVAGVSQAKINAIDVSKLPSDAEDNTLHPGDVERYAEVYTLLEADAKFRFVDKAMMDEVNQIVIRANDKLFRMAFIDYIRIKLLRYDHAWPQFMTHVAWIFLFLWCAMCSVIAIVYGIQFDITYETGQSSAFAKQGYDEECWDMDPQLVINEELAEQQLLDDADALNDNFGSHVTDSKAWLLQLLQSVIVSVFVWQPLTIYVITWLNIWLFSWNLPVSLKPPNLIKLFKNVFGMVKEEPEGNTPGGTPHNTDFNFQALKSQSEIQTNGVELATRKEKEKHEEMDTMDVAALIQSNPEFVEKMAKENTYKAPITTKAKGKKKVAFKIDVANQEESERTNPRKGRKKHQKQRSQSVDISAIIASTKEDKNVKKMKGRGRAKDKTKSSKKRSKSVVSEMGKEKQKKVKTNTKPKSKKRTKSEIVISDSNSKKKSPMPKKKVVLKINVVNEEEERINPRKNKGKKHQKQRSQSVDISAIIASTKEDKNVKKMKGRGRAKDKTKSSKKRSKSVVSEMGKEKQKKVKTNTKPKSKKRTKSEIVISDSNSKKKSPKSPMPKKKVVLKINVVNEEEERINPRKNKGKKHQKQRSQSVDISAIIASTTEDKNVKKDKGRGRARDKTKKGNAKSSKKRSKSVVNEEVDLNKKSETPKSPKTPKQNKTSKLTIDTKHSKRSKSAISKDVKDKYKKGSVTKRPKTMRASKAKPKSIKPRSKTPRPQSTRVRSKTAGKKKANTQSSKKKKIKAKATTPRPQSTRSKRSAKKKKGTNTKKKGTKTNKKGVKTKKKRSQTMSTINDVKGSIVKQKEEAASEEELKLQTQAANTMFNLSGMSKEVVHETTIRYKSGGAQAIYDIDDTMDKEGENDKETAPRKRTIDALQDVSNSSYRLFSLSSLSPRSTPKSPVISPFSVTVEKSLRSWEELDEETREIHLNHYDNLYQNIVSHQFRPFDVYAFFGTRKYFMTIVKTWYGLDCAGYEKPAPVIEVEEEEEEESTEEEESSSEYEEPKPKPERDMKKVQPWHQAVSFMG